MSSTSIRRWRLGRRFDLCEQLRRGLAATRALAKILDGLRWDDSLVVQAAKFAGSLTLPFER